MSRRGFIKQTGLTVMGLAASQGLGSSATSAESGRRKVILDKGWYLKSVDAAAINIAQLTGEARAPDTSWLSTTLPRQVQDVLHDHGRIPDPAIGKNAADCTWVFEKDWVYASKFPTPARKGPVFLRFSGMDTQCDVYLNNRLVGTCNNMFRTFSFEISSHMKTEQENMLLLVFHSPTKVVDKIGARIGEDPLVRPVKYLRKSCQDFQSYLGPKPHFIKMGVYREVVLDIPGPAWFEEVWLRPSVMGETGLLKVLADAQGKFDRLEWILMDPAGRTQRGEAAAGKQVEMDIKVTQPELWWPRTHGNPSLYTLTLNLIIDGRVIDTWSHPVGFRTIETVRMDPGTGEERFGFKINGQMIFLKGGCWAPLDGKSHVWDQKRAMRLLDMAEEAHFNIFRIWGEGHIPPKEFYLECDRRGFLIWQDFMTGCRMDHPMHDPGFRDNISAEIIDNIKRLRNHPSLLLWCGGNEHYKNIECCSDDINDPMGRELFEVLMPKLADAYDPTRLFHPSSPWGNTAVPNDPLSGDWHDYTGVNFMPNSSVPLFVSEFCRVSSPPLSEMQKIMTPEEVWPEGFVFRITSPGEPAWPPMWEYRAIRTAWEKKGPIEKFMEPQSAEDLVRVLGIAHGEENLRYIGQYRRGTPSGQPDGNRRCWGCTVWRFNDAWPIIYMANVGYYLEPKIPYYYLKRVHEPVLVDFEKADDEIHAWVVNDSPDPVQGSLELLKMNFDGENLGSLSRDIVLGPGEARRGLCATPLGLVNLTQEFLAARFNDKTYPLLLAGERYLKLPQAHLSVKRSESSIHIFSDKYARQVCLEIPGTSGAWFSDNWFDLIPGQSRIIRILDRAQGNQLRIRALNSEAVLMDL